MSSRLPEPPSQLEPGGISDLADPDPSERGLVDPPRDTAVAVNDFGTTPGEQAGGESLDGRLAREQADVLADLGTDTVASEKLDDTDEQRAGQTVGRIVESDEGARRDTESEMVATDVGTDRGGYSAEEAAMHLEPEA